jgi:site-specific recombinase XerC
MNDEANIEQYLAIRKKAALEIDSVQVSADGRRQVFRLVQKKSSPMSQPAAKTMGEILTPKSRRWEAFTLALEHALQFNGCDGGEPENAPENVHRTRNRSCL